MRFDNETEKLASDPRYCYGRTRNNNTGGTLTINPYQFVARLIIDIELDNKAYGAGDATAKKFPLIGRDADSF